MCPKSCLCLQGEEGKGREGKEKRKKRQSNNSSWICWLRVCPCSRKKGRTKQKDDWLIAADWVMMRLIITIIIIRRRRRICPFRDWILLSFLWESVCVCVVVIVVVVCGPTNFLQLFLGSVCNCGPTLWLSWATAAQHAWWFLPSSLPPSLPGTYLLTSLLLPALHNNNPTHLELMNTWDPSWSIADSD
jgi:hypothetical protein